MRWLCGVAGRHVKVGALELPHLTRPPTPPTPHKCRCGVVDKLLCSIWHFLPKGSIVVLSETIVRGLAQLNIYVSRIAQYSKHIHTAIVPTSVLIQSQVTTSFSFIVSHEFLSMKIIIVGAGLGGLGCAIACRRQGFDVLVLDRVPEFLRIGDSIGFGSNSARLLHRWGVGEQLERIAGHIQEIRIYNFDSSDNLLGLDDHIQTSKEKFGCRPIIGHRGDFHLILYNFAVSLGVDIRMNTPVVDYDVSKPSITLDSGEEIASDVVIIADGARSKGRKTVLGYEDKPLHSGYAIYRSFMKADTVRDDPLINKFFERGDSVNLFLAPDMHGFVVTLRDGKEINAVLTHKDTADVQESWTKPGEKNDVLKLLEGWDPAVRRVWEKMETIVDWKLVYRPCLDKWVADSGKIALMGDAAHPFLPTSAQGASQAIEDGATIAKCLANCNGDIALALHTYFEIRHDWVADAQATGIKQRETWHSMHSGDTKAFKESFDINAVALSNLHLWENDAEKVVDDRWEKVSAAVAKKLESGTTLKTM